MSFVPVIGRQVAMNRSASGAERPWFTITGPTLAAAREMENRIAELEQKVAEYMVLSAQRQTG